MSNDLIERVAMALCRALGGEWREPPFNDLKTEALNNGWRFAARVAIEVMAEPTEAICQALEFGPMPDVADLDGTAKAIWAPSWRAAIKAALDE